MPEFSDAIHQPSCLAATCMARRDVLPVVVAMGVDLPGEVVTVDNHPPAFSRVVSLVGNLWSRRLPILGEIMTMNYITVFN